MYYQKFYNIITLTTSGIAFHFLYWWGDFVKEKILEIIGNSLDKLNVYVYDVVYEKEGGFNYLRVILDSNDIIDMNKVVEASKIINPILDKANPIEDKYILDVYAKSKGDE